MLREEKEDTDTTRNTFTERSEDSGSPASPLVLEGAAILGSSAD